MLIKCISIAAAFNLQGILAAINTAANCPHLFAYCVCTFLVEFTSAFHYVDTRIYTHVHNARLSLWMGAVNNAGLTLSFAHISVMLPFVEELLDLLGRVWNASRSSSRSGPWSGFRLWVVGFRVATACLEMHIFSNYIWLPRTHTHAHECPVSWSASPFCHFLFHWHFRPKAAVQPLGQFRHFSQLLLAL